MTPQQIKTRARQALKEQKQDGRSGVSLAFDVLEALLDPDIFIGYRASKDTTWQGDLTRVLRDSGRCNACGINIPAGTKAVWIKGSGVWHIACYDGGTR